MDESRTPRKKKQKTKKKMERRIHLALGNDELIAALKKICIGIGKFNKGINVDRFFLHFVAGGYDPYDVTGIFALVNALICTLAPVFADRFHCRKLSVSTDIDYNREDMLCDVSIEMTVRIGRIFAMINTILFGLIVVLIKNRILWYRLKCSDPEEYEFERAHPSAATKLIMGLLNNKHQPVGENAGLK